MNTTMHQAVRMRRAGFTIVELLTAITLFGVLIVGVLSALQSETTAFRESTRRLVALRNANYAFTRLEQDLRTAGINLPFGQPELVYLGPDVVAFTSDNVSNLSNDPFAVFVNVDAPNGQVRLASSAVSIPNSGGFQFPTVSYEVSPGVSSQAELIIFYLEPDATTDYEDDYVLWRQINGNAPERIARNILEQPGEPFFSFYERPNSGGLVQLADSVRLSHDIPVHQALADTGAVARIDRIRAVEVKLRATNGAPGDDEKIVSGSRLIDLPNVGFGSLSTCGDEPILGVSPSVVGDTLPSGDPALVVTWGQATDESSGEKDVANYLLWRRVGGAASWGDPLASIPAGSVSYRYEDTTAESGTDYEYGLATQDCTPSLSPVAASAAVTMPAS